MAKLTPTQRVARRIVEGLGGVPAEHLAQVETALTERLAALGQQVEVTRSQASTRAREAYAQGYGDGSSGNDEPASGTLQSYGYRRALAGGLRDFTRISYDRILEIVWSVFQSNPVAKRALEIKIAYLLGSKLAPQYADDNVATILEAFWEKNKLNAMLPKWALELRLFGEQVYPVFVRESDGRVELGHIDPAEIVAVITHPDNALKRCAVVVKDRAPNPAEPWTGWRGQRVYRVVREDEAVVTDMVDAMGRPWVVPPRYPGKLVTWQQVAVLEPWEYKMLEQYGLPEYSGSVLLYQVNGVSNQARGYSDLLQVLDWLDQLDAVLFALADREQMAGFFVFDVAIDGTPEDVERRKREILASPPRRGDANVHNTPETWKLDAPDLKQIGSIETARTLIGHIFGGVGMPVHWYGRGDDANLATATAQGDPTWRTLELDQGQLQAEIVQILTFARDQAEIAGALVPVQAQDETGAPQPAPDDWRKITLPMPEMVGRDMVAAAQALTAIVAACATAIAEGLVTRLTAIKLLAKVAKELGVEIDPQAELDAVDEERAVQGLQAAGQRGDMLQARLDATAQSSQSVTDGATVAPARAVTQAVAGQGDLQAQVSSLLEIVGMVSRNEITRETALGIIKAAFPLIPQESIDAILGAAGTAAVVPAVAANGKAGA